MVVRSNNEYVQVPSQTNVYYPSVQWPLSVNDTVIDSREIHQQKVLIPPIELFVILLNKMPSPFSDVIFYYVQLKKNYIFTSLANKLSLCCCMQLSLQPLQALEGMACRNNSHAKWQSNIYLDPQASRMFVQQLSLWKGFRLFLKEQRAITSQASLTPVSGLHRWRT